MDILLEQTAWNESSAALPLRSDQAPWKDIVSLRDSRGEQVFLRKMTRALKHSMPRLKKSSSRGWGEDLRTIAPWRELTACAQSLRDFWQHCLRQPGSDEVIPTFKAWRDSRESGQPWTVWEAWHLLSLLYLRGRQLPDSLFWEVWNLAAQAFTELRDQLDPPEGATGTLDQFLIAAVELRWLALAVFPEIEDAVRIPKLARKALTGWYQSFLTDDDKPDSEDLSRLPEVWRSLARTAEVCEQLEQDYFRNSDQRTLRKLLTTTCRLTGADGRLLLGGSVIPWAYLYTLGRQVAAKKPSGLKSLLKTYQTQQNSFGKVSAARKGCVPSLKPCQQTDSGHWAVLRSKWIDAVDACLVQHESATVRIQLQAITQTLFSGPWSIEIESHGQPVSLLDEWEAVCWYSDTDGDYLELQQKLADDIALERQLFLSRREHFLYASEVVHAPDNREIAVRSTLPIAPALHVEQDQYTREWKLKRKKKTVARLFPLAFDQEIIHKTAGAISASANGRPTLTVERSARGSLFLPMIIDWHPHHQAAPAEWRKLTITQSLQICPANVAGGYRLRLADQHLLIFRSLRESFTPRAVLGHHTMHESLIAKFDTDGDVEPLLIVEAGGA